MYSTTDEPCANNGEIPAHRVIHARARILIFAKAPVAGRCKTRLARGIGAPRAAGVYRNLLVATVARAVDSGLAPVCLCCAPDCRHGVFTSLRRAYGLELQAQARGDLGRRMHQAFRRALRDADYAVLVGADAPGMGRRHLSAALATLHGGADAVLAPARDGGYTLIGLRRVDPRLFRGLPWGSAEVLPATRWRLRRLGLTWRELPPLDDIDDRRDFLNAKRNGLLEDVIGDR